MAVTQIDGSRQIKSASIADAQIAAGAAIATTKLADSANFILRGGSVAFTADQSMGGNKLTNVATPSAGTDAANKAYVDAAASGIDWKASVRAATTAAGTLASSFANGQTIDGVTLATGDRILIKNQSTGSENGIYTVAASGSPVRATDADSNSEVSGGMAVFVEEGTVNADTGWVMTNNGAITLGTTALVFTQFTGLGSVNAGAGLTQTGNTLDVVGTANRIVVNANDIDIGTDVVTLTGSQTLTNKTLTTPTIGSFTNATHNHTNAAGGGQLTPSTALSATGTPSSSTYLRGDNSWQTISAPSSFATRETPSGLVNGANTTYTLANTPIAGSEEVFLNGILQEPGAGNDYTISGATITYLTAPATGDKIRVSYRY